MTNGEFMKESLCDYIMKGGLSEYIHHTERKEVCDKVRGMSGSDFYEYMSEYMWDDSLDGKLFTCEYCDKKYWDGQDSTKCGRYEDVDPKLCKKRFLKHYRQKYIG